MEAGQDKTAVRRWMADQGRAGRRAALRVALLGLFGIAAAVGQAWCAAGVLAALIGPGPAGVGRDATPLLAVFAVLGAVRAGLRWAAERMAFAAGAAGRRRLRADALRRVLDAGPALLRTRQTGELVSMVVDRIEAVDGLFARWLPASLLAVGGPLLVAAAATVADPLAGAVLAGAGLLVPMGMALAGLGAAAASRGQFLALSRLQSRFLDRLRGIGTIVLAGRAEDEARALGAAADELRRRTMRVLRVAFLSSATLDLAMAAALVLLALHYAGAADPARGLFPILLVAEFFAPLRSFSVAYQDRFSAAAAADALAGLPPLVAAPASGPVRTVAAQGVTVGFEDVWLTWDASRGPALRGISFRVPAGEVLVLAGPSGAGKSSVMELLLGFVQPDKGRITLNGAPMNTILPEALTRILSWIGQRPLIFAGTLRDNIRFARPDATDKEVQAAARAASVLSFAAELPKGLDTPVGEGGYGLSGGQAQRVAIARAFLKNAPLLLLDEPTAHLDPATEGEVLDSLRRLMVGRTVILAGHSAAVRAFGRRRLDLRDGQVLSVQGVA